MWTLTNGITDKVVVPADGIISVTKPDSVQVLPYVNEVTSAVHHVHVKAGDTVYFKMENTAQEATQVVLEYAGTTSNILVEGNKTIAPIGAEGKIMEHEMNYFGGGAGAGAGAGLGAGLVGGLIGGQLFGNQNRNNNYGNTEGIVTPSLLASSLDAVTSNVRETTILTALGDIKASIPLAEGQVQLALAGSTADINRNITGGTVSVIQGQAGINKGLSDAIATSLASQATIRAEALVAAGALQASILQNKYDLSTTVRDDGDKTRSLIVAQNNDMLNRELTVAQSALLEARAVGREQNNSINITNTMTQNQAQAQFQAQQQQQFQILANLNAAVVNLANDIQVVRQTQSNVNFGVQGTAGQVASAANTRVN